MSSQMNENIRCFLILIINILLINIYDYTRSFSIIMTHNLIMFGDQNIIKS